MHELSLALNVLELVQEECLKAEAVHVAELVITAGTLSGVDEEALTACLVIAAKGTVLENARIIISRKTGTGFCTNCRSTFPMEDILTLCPECHQAPSRLLDGQDLQVESLMVE